MSHFVIILLSVRAVLSEVCDAAINLFDYDSVYDGFLVSCNYGLK